MNVVLMDFGIGMARLMCVAIYFTAFYVPSRNESEGTVIFGSTNKSIMFAIN